MGHDHDMFPANLALFRQKVPSKEKGSPYHVVEARCGQPSLDHLGMIGAGEREIAAGPGAHGLKDSALPLPVEKVASGNAIAAALDLRPYNDKLVRIGIRHGGEQSGVDHAEDGGVRPDA